MTQSQGWDGLPCYPEGVTAHSPGSPLRRTLGDWHSDLKKWPDSDLNRPEYMSPPMFGYALAHLAWHRGEEWPDWAAYLNWSVRGEFKQGLRYLRTTGDSWFRPKGWRPKAV